MLDLRRVVVPRQLGDHKDSAQVTQDRSSALGQAWAGTLAIPQRIHFVISLRSWAVQAESLFLTAADSAVTDCSLAEKYPSRQLEVVEYCTCCCFWAVQYRLEQEHDSSAACSLAFGVSQLP